MWWAVHPDAAEEEDGELDADRVRVEAGPLGRRRLFALAHRRAAADAAPYDPAAPLAADIQVEKYGAVFDEIDR